jgi:hypothetical protein
MGYNSRSTPSIFSLEIILARNLYGHLSALSGRESRIS